MAVTVGSGRVGELSAAQVALVPAGVVTVTSTVPVPAGDVGRDRGGADHGDVGGGGGAEVHGGGAGEAGAGHGDRGAAGERARRWG